MSAKGRPERESLPHEGTARSAKGAPVRRAPQAGAVAPAVAVCGLLRRLVAGGVQSSSRL
jgi:hypothetical protein